MPERRVEGEEAETAEAEETEEVGRSLGREEWWLIGAPPGAMIEVLAGKFKEEEERDAV